jgi:hypothetical protein
VNQLEELIVEFTEETHEIPCESRFPCESVAVWYHHWTCLCISGQNLCSHHKERGEREGSKHPANSLFLHTRCRGLVRGADVFSRPPRPR